MKSKNKKIFLFILVLLAASAASVFCYVNFARAADSLYGGLTITEIMYNPAGNNTEHAKWVEFANLSSDKITLNPTGSKTASGWKIKDLKINDLSNHYLYTQENTPIEVSPGGFLIVTDNLANFGNDYSDLKNIPVLKSAITLTAADSNGNYNLTLYDNTFSLDTIIYSKDWYKNTDDKGKSLEKIDLSGDNEKGNWRESCKDDGTPGKEPGMCETETHTSNESSGAENTSKGTESADTGSRENFSSAEKVYLNETLPHPKDDEKTDEFIEIMNQENGPVDLFGWTIRDGSKTGKYVFKEHMEIKSGEYLAIYRPESKLALNNSTETVALFNPRGEITSSVSWEKSIEGSSYNYDGTNWKWSKYLTPGKENKFDSEPTVKINKPKNAFKGLLTEFSAKAKDKETKNLKYVWDFGDGKKSYLAKTSHKYLDTGKYSVTLTVSDDSQTVKKSFAIAVKNYPRPDLEIVKIIPNPAGNDSAGEAIDIKNNSGKKVDLQGWKIATGSSEKMYDHPINDEITLDSGETKIITREVSKFSLNNKAGKVRLVSPDEKIIDEVEYSKEKISEGEVYAKTDGEWQWIAISDNPPEKEKSSASEDSSENENDKNNSSEEEGILGAADENAPYYAPIQTGYAPEDAFIFFKFFGLLEYRPREMNFCPANQSLDTLAYLLVPSQ